jgi:hypothetical protein
MVKWAQVWVRSFEDGMALTGGHGMGSAYNATSKRDNQQGGQETTLRFRRSGSWLNLSLGKFDGVNCNGVRGGCPFESNDADFMRESTVKNRYDDATAARRTIYYVIPDDEFWHGSAP